MNIIDVRFGNTKIVNIYADQKNINLPSLSFDGDTILFDYNDYLNISTKYDYKPTSQYYCIYIKLKPNTAYVISVDAGSNTGLILLNNISDVYTGSYIDLRKDSAQAKAYTTNEMGYLYMGSSTSLSDEVYNNIISTRNIQITEK